MHTARNSFILFATLALGVADARAQIAPRYRLIDLGSLGGQTGAMGINNAGQIAGFGSLPDSNAFRATRWDGTLDPFGLAPGSTQALATAIGPSGELYGVGFVLGDPSMHALRFDAPPPAPVDLGIFTPKAVNASGLVVGLRNETSSGFLLPKPCAFEAGLLSALQLPAGWLTGQAFAVNDAGIIVGSGLSAQHTTPRPLMWASSTSAPLDLGTLAGTATTGGQARAINTQGEIVGWSKPTSTPPHATLWRLASPITGGVAQRIDLGTLASGATSYANAINDEGVVVGTSNFAAFAWHSGTLVDLNTRLDSPHEGWTLEIATGINTSGHIVGTGTFLGFPRAFLLVPSCGAADLGGQGGLPGADSLLDNNDFVVFIDLFFAADPQADVGSQGGVLGSDSLFDNNDFVAFIDLFFTGC